MMKINKTLERYMNDNYYDFQCGKQFNCNILTTTGNNKNCEDCQYYIPKYKMRMDDAIESERKLNITAERNRKCLRILMGDNRYGYYVDKEYNIIQFDRVKTRNDMYFEEVDFPEDALFTSYNKKQCRDYVRDVRWNILRGWKKV
jgi:hypothetical protein